MARSLSLLHSISVLRSFSLLQSQTVSYLAKCHVGLQLRMKSGIEAKA
jgi:hypothetical protein